MKKLLLENIVLFIVWLEWLENQPFCHNFNIIIYRGNQFL